MTPNDIEVLLHAHVSPAPHPRLTAPAVKRAHEMLEATGLIVRSPQFVGFETTIKGRAHVVRLCNLPVEETK